MYHPTMLLAVSNVNVFPLAIMLSFISLDVYMQMILQEVPQVKHFGIQRKPLPLEPTLLLREANRRRASLSAGNVFELFDGRANATDR